MLMKNPNAGGWAYPADDEVVHVAFPADNINGEAMNGHNNTQLNTGNTTKS